jgi:hypothetical protein
LEEVVPDTFIQIPLLMVDMVAVEIAVMVHQQQVMQAQLALEAVVVEVEKQSPQVELVDLVSLLLDTQSK